MTFASDPMALQDRLNAMTPEERRTQASLITDDQYEALHAGQRWSPSNDEEWLAVWCRNRDSSGWQTAKQFGNVPMYLFTLPMRPVEYMFMQAAKAYPSDAWEGIGMGVLMPLMIVGSGFVWYWLFKTVRGTQ